MSYSKEQYLDYSEDYAREHTPYFECVYPPRQSMVKRIGKSIANILRSFRPRQKPDAFEQALAAIRTTERIEGACSCIQRMIRSCNDCEQLPAIQRMIDNLPIIYGTKTQVTSWVDSLNLQMFNKSKEFNNQ